MTLLQALLIAFFGYLSSIFSPGFHSRLVYARQAAHLGFVIGSSWATFQRGSSWAPRFGGVHRVGDAWRFDARGCKSRSLYRHPPRLGQRYGRHARRFALVISALRRAGGLVVVTVNCLFCTDGPLLSRGRLTAAARTPASRRSRISRCGFSLFFWPATLGRASPSPRRTRCLPLWSEFSACLARCCLWSGSQCCSTPSSGRKRTFYSTSSVHSRAIAPSADSVLAVYRCVIAFLDVRTRCPRGIAGC